jgi:predicted NAD/FAD-dependent oxidoreductase
LSCLWRYCCIDEANVGEFETSDSEAGVVACGSGTGGRSGGETPSDDGGSCCCRGS